MQKTLRSPFADIRLPRPDWFDASIKTVLDGADATLSAGSIRELEQVTAELLGAELYRAVQEGHGGLQFDWWFHELADAAATRSRENRDEAIERLLHGMAAIGSPALRSYAEQHLPKRALNDWPRVTTTGEIWRMRDAYGTRFGVIAGFSYPGVFLFDVDASGFSTLVGAGVFDDVEQAGAAWREWVGDSAQGVLPTPAGTAGDLHCLVESESADIMGDESRNAMDNWFRVNRRLHDLAELDLLPDPPNLYHDVDLMPMTDEFTGWYSTQHRTPPDPEVIEAIAEDWMEGKLPETWFSVSPRRVAHLRALVSDWVPEFGKPGEAMLSDWVRWLTERNAIPAHLTEPVLAALTAPLER
ncbi:hypothetical protein [Amycolatopsis alkalitolerans]|uniref:Uncharacterized protein n=1 Tax=Amycolatopsis alkalitolerans TaxID=2547244 RepID=A0A5C4M119_9PSEU|nr:hypothetical protein [Amycolatopsis alkalitolerans]TNC26401.1 hypothetical protein FG385_11615 [Amycolatopsis alkalitolerans]